MISISKVTENKNKVLSEFKQLEWIEIKTSEQGIKFLKNVSQNKITHINKNINRKKNMLKKIDRDIKKCELDIIKITKYIDAKSLIITDKNQINCPICMDKINKDSIIITKCGHLYCRNCLLKSLKVKENCPICRENIKEESDYITIHFHNTGNYKILKKEIIQQNNLSNNDDIIIIQNTIRRNIARIHNRESQNEFNNNLRNESRETLENQNIRLRQVIRNYDAHLALLENNLISQTSTNLSNLSLNIEPRIEEPINIVNTYFPNNSRRYLNSIAQKDLIIRIQKNLINSLKSHITSLREYIDIQNRIIDTDN